MTGTGIWKYTGNLTCCWHLQLPFPRIIYLFYIFLFFYIHENENVWDLQNQVILSCIIILLLLYCITIIKTGKQNMDIMRKIIHGSNCNLSLNAKLQLFNAINYRQIFKSTVEQSLKVQYFLHTLMITKTSSEKKLVSEIKIQMTVF